MTELRTRVETQLLAPLELAHVTPLSHQAASACMEATFRRLPRLAGLGS